MKHKIHNNQVMVVFRFNEPSFMTIAIVPGGMCTCLAQCILVDSSTIVCWTSPFVILGGRVYFVALIVFLMENPVSKQCRPWSDATSCSIWSGSALFAYDPFTGIRVRMSYKRHGFWNYDLMLTLSVGRLGTVHSCYTNNGKWYYCLWLSTKMIPCWLFWLPQQSHGLSAAYWSSGCEFEPCLRKNLLNRKWGSIAHSISLSTSHCPDMTEILLKRT